MDGRRMAAVYLIPCWDYPKLEYCGMRTNTSLVHRIVVLDADQAAAMRICLLLRGMGHRALRAADARDALDLVRVENADCILVAIDSPDEGALDLCREVKQGRTVVAFALSGRGSADQERAAKAGFDGWLVRPFGYDEARLLFGDLRA